MSFLFRIYPSSKKGNLLSPKRKSIMVELQLVVGNGILCFSRLDEIVLFILCKSISQGQT